MSQKIQFKVRLSPDVKSQIQAFAERMGISMSVLTTKALVDYLDRNSGEPEKPKNQKGEM
jgi:predicted transcriptional regulator